jgi:hypothetical protein
MPEKKIGLSNLVTMANMLGGVSMMANMLDSPYDPSSKRGTNPLRPEDIKIENKRVIPKGCKVFTINGVEIVAINEKNAMRKYKKNFPS